MTSKAYKHTVQDYTHWRLDGLAKVCTSKSSRHSTGFQVMLVLFSSDDITESVPLRAEGLTQQACRHSGPPPPLSIEAGLSTEHRSSLLLIRGLGCVYIKAGGLVPCSQPKQHQQLLVYRVDEVRGFLSTFIQNLPVSTQREEIPRREQERRH